MRPSHYQTRYKFDLTPRQRDVLGFIARGRTNGEIADALGLSLDGVKWHVREILGKLGVESRDEAARIWRSENRPLRRLSRVIATFILGGAATKFAAVATVLAIGGVSVVTLLSALDDAGDERPPQQLSTPEALSPVPPRSFTPAGRIDPLGGRTTGIPALDDLIERINNVTAVKSRVRFGLVPCRTGTPDTVTEPTCGTGQAPAKMVEPMPVDSFCGGTPLAPGDIPSLIDGQRVLRLHSAFELSADDRRILQASVALLFQESERRDLSTLSGTVLFAVNEQGEIFAIVRDCGSTADQVFADHAKSGVLLPPPASQAVIPTPNDSEPP